MASPGTCISMPPTGPCRTAGPQAVPLACAVVLGGDLYDRLGVCTAPRCDRVYVDTSRNGTRRYCSTSCQNRVKTAAFRAIAGRLSAIERHLGMDSGGPENVIPPS